MVPAIGNPPASTLDRATVGPVSRRSGGRPYGPTLVSVVVFPVFVLPLLPVVALCAPLAFGPNPLN